MLLLPFFTGILLIFQGQNYQVFGTRNRAASELEDYNKFLDELSLYRRIVETQKRRQQEQLSQQEPAVEWSDVAVNDNIQDKALDSGTNFAAADNPPEDVPSELSEGSNFPDDVTTTAKIITSTKLDVPKTGHDPLPPKKLVSEDSGSVDAITKRDFVFLTVVSACSVAGLVGLIMAGVCWYKLHKRVKAATDVDYPAYGVTGPTKERLPSPGDRKLAQSAQMYHYQHQKQQMIAMEKANSEMKQDASEDESEEENEEGDYTVYECPGLAPTGEMEVRNPLFTEDAQTPVNGQPSTAVNGLPEERENE